MQKNSSKLVALGTLGVIMSSTLGGLTAPAQASWVSRHRTTTAIAAVGGYLAYRHYKKKHAKKHYAYTTHRAYRHR